MRVIRKPLAVLGVVAVLAGVMSNSVLAFTDVPANHGAAGAFGLLEDLQVYRGYPDGSARPTATIRRDEFCAIVVRMIGQESLAETRASDRPDFSDDIPGWAWGYVNVATSLEIIYGYDDHTFRPANPVTFAEGFAMLTRALELDRVATGAWPGKYIDLAARIGLDVGLSVSPDAVMTRADIALATANAMVSRWCHQEGDGLVQGPALLERPPYAWTAEAVDDMIVRLAGSPSERAPSRRGNTIGNLMNMGLFCYSDGWFYYRHERHETRPNPNEPGRVWSLRRMRPDGTSDEMLLDDCVVTSINVYDGWIYFCDEHTMEDGLCDSVIMRMRVDGSQPEILLNLTEYGGDESLGGNMQVVDDWIYFTADLGAIDGERNGLWRMRLDGGGLELVVSGQTGVISSVSVVDDWAYFRWYQLSSPFGWAVRRIRVDGTDLQTLPGFFDLERDLGGILNYDFLFVEDGYIYFDHTNWADDPEHPFHVYRSNLDGTNIELLLDSPSRKGSNYGLNVSGGWVYFYDDVSDNWWRMRVDGTDREQLTSHEYGHGTIWGVYVVGDWLVYAYWGYYTGTCWYRTPLSGGETELLYVVLPPK